MGKASVEVKFEFPDLLGALNASLPRIERVIASTIQTQVGMRFDAEGSHNGHEKWAPLKSRQGQILSLSGDLRKSVSPLQADGNPGPGGFVNFSGDVVNLLTEVGTKLIYAGVHNNGATIRPKNKKSLKFMIGNRAIFAKSVSIPKRNFTDMNQADEDELNETLANLISEILETA